MNNQNDRDVLMLSYASNDSADLVTWLAVKLTMAGYKVWLDKLKLKGGRPFIKDIEDVIKDDAFRVLALMSPGAVTRKNPKRERALASQVRDRISIDDFIIPIRAHVDFKSTDLDFYTTDHQWIDFTQNWALGFKELLGVLQEAKAPRGATPDQAMLDQLIDIDAKADERDEVLWSNLLPLEIPEHFYVYSFDENKAPSTNLVDWAAWRVHKTSEYFAFRPPPRGKGYKFTEVAAVRWREVKEFNGVPTINVIKSLIRKEIEYDCVRRGMRYTLDGKKIFFPRGAVPKDRISFRGYAGKTWIQTVSDRKYLAASDGRCLGHLSPSFRVDFSDPANPAVRINLGLHITFTNDKPVPASRIPGRRKKFTQFWFNHAWLSRTEAVAQWLSGGESKRDLFRYRGDALTIYGQLSSFNVTKGIDESKLGAVEDLEVFDDSNVIQMPRVEQGVADEGTGF